MGPSVHNSYPSPLCSMRLPQTGNCSTTLDAGWNGRVAADERTLNGTSVNGYKIAAVTTTTVRQFERNSGKEVSVETLITAGRTPEGEMTMSDNRTTNEATVPTATGAILDIDYTTKTTTTTTTSTEHVDGTTFLQSSKQIQIMEQSFVSGINTSKADVAAKSATVVTSTSSNGGMTITDVEGKTSSVWITGQEQPDQIVGKETADIEWPSFSKVAMVETQLQGTLNIPAITKEQTANGKMHRDIAEKISSEQATVTITEKASSSASKVATQLQVGVENPDTETVSAFEKTTVTDKTPSPDRTITNGHTSHKTKAVELQIETAQVTSVSAKEKPVQTELIAEGDGPAEHLKTVHTKQSAKSPRASNLVEDLEPQTVSVAQTNIFQNTFPIENSTETNRAPLAEIENTAAKTTRTKLITANHPPRSQIQTSIDTFAATDPDSTLVSITKEKCPLEINSNHSDESKYTATTVGETTIPKIVNIAGARQSNNINLKRIANCNTDTDEQPFAAQKQVSRKISVEETHVSKPANKNAAKHLANTAKTKTKKIKTTEDEPAPNMAVNITVNDTSNSKTEQKACENPLQPTNITSPENPVLLKSKTKMAKIEANVDFIETDASSAAAKLKPANKNIDKQSVLATESVTNKNKQQPSSKAAVSKPQTVSAEPPQTVAVIRKKTKMSKSSNDTSVSSGHQKSANATATETRRYRCTLVLLLLLLLFVILAIAAFSAWRSEM